MGVKLKSIDKEIHKLEKSLKKSPTKEKRIQLKQLKRAYNKELGKKLRFLHRILSRLFYYYPIGHIQFKEYWTDGKICLYYSDNTKKEPHQAEVINSWTLPIDERIKVNLRAYKLYRKKYFKIKELESQKGFIQLQLPIKDIKDYADLIRL